MKRFLKKSIAAILVLSMSMALLTATAFAADDNDEIYVIRSDVEVSDITMRGVVYIAEDVTLTTSGEVALDGEVYVYGTWINTATISGEGTIHCAHYNSSSLPSTARGVFRSTYDTSRPSGPISVSTNSSYLNDPIPEGYTWDPLTDPNPEPEPEPEPDPEPEPEPDPEPVPEPDSSLNGLSKASDGNWYYYKDGEIDTAYSGFAENTNGKWYVESGEVTFKTTGVLKDTAGDLGEKGAWYYVVNSKVQTTYTGVANHKNANGWWYVKNGKVDFSANTVAKNNNGWWYVTGGKVQFGYTGVANYKNSNGWWYISKGKVNFNANTVAKNNKGWWYVEKGKVNFNYTGVANYKNSYGWWYVKNGKVDFTFNGKAKNKNGTWNVVNGKVRF